MGCAHWRFHLNSKFTDWNLFSTIPPEAYTLIVEYAAVLAVLGSIDLLTSVIADNMTKTRHNSNRELIGQGIGNMLAAAFGESLVQEQRTTVVNINAGGNLISEQFMAYFY
jgi:SulP family sulfate permease